MPLPKIMIASPHIRSSSMLNLLYGVLPYLALLASAVTVLVLIIISRYDLLSKSALILLSVSFASILVIVAQHHKLYNNVSLSHVVDNLPTTHNSNNNNRLVKLYFTLFIFAISLFLLIGERSYIYLICVIILFFIILIQIFSKFHEKNRIIIIELICLCIFTISTKYISYGYYFHSSDILATANLVATVLSTSGIGYQGIDYTYAQFPLYPIILSIGSLLSSLSVYDFIHLSTLFAGLLVRLPLIYIIAKLITKSEGIANLSIFIYVLIPIVLDNIIDGVARVFITSILIIIAYLFVKKWDKSNNTFQAIILCIIGVLFITLGHCVQIFLALFILSIGLLILVVQNYKFLREFVGLLGVCYLIPILYFLYQSLRLFKGVILTKLVGFDAVNIIIDDNLLIVNENAYFYNTLCSVSLAIFSLVALYYLLSGKKSIILINMAIIAMLFIVFFLPGIADISTYIVTSLEIERIRDILSPLFAIISAIGCVVIIYSVDKLIQLKSKISIGKVGVIFLCIILVISTPILIQSRDTPIFSSNSGLYDNTYFYSSDLSMFNTINTYLHSGAMITSDYYSERYVPYKAEYGRLNIKYYLLGNSIQYFFENTSTLSDHYDLGTYIIFREKSYVDGGLVIRSLENDERIKIYNTESSNKYSIKNSYYLNNIYNNGAGSIYRI